MMNDFKKIKEGILNYGDKKNFEILDFLENWVLIWTKSSDEITNFILNNTVILNFKLIKIYF